jgi:hypothetical protein
MPLTESGLLHRAEPRVSPFIRAGDFGQILFEPAKTKKAATRAAFKR